jgi:hypothetical protein
MATKKEIDEHLKRVLKEIGEITPVFDEEVGEWLFTSRLYPVEYGGPSEKEMIKNYPKYLREFIKLPRRQAPPFYRLRDRVSCG